MSEEREFLTAEQAEAMLPDTERIHTFRNPAGILLGADWDRADLLEAIKSADSRELGGDACTRMGHGLVLIDSHGTLFVETKKAIAAATD